MIRNGRDISSGSLITTQVCIVGTGPAGVTAAYLLQKAGYKVTLLEGSRDFAGDLRASWPDKVLLYNGVADGLFATNEPDFLILPFTGHTSPAWERERIFGGTSSHWGGQSRPLNPITFAARDGFPGWPISRADLDPYYTQAARFCLLHGDDFTAETWARTLQAEVPRLEGFDVEMYQFIGQDFLNFSTRTFDGITIGQSAADVILNASVLAINAQGGSVQSLSVASMDDAPTPKPRTQFTVRADVVVLACGAVANARQLLLSNLGNQSGWVGRSFMCHPLSQSGVISITRPYLTDAQSRLMDGRVPGGGQWRDANGVTVTGRFVPNAEEATKLGIGQCWFWAGGGQYYYEMTPNPNSRVTLDPSRDPVFGQPQTRITWQLTPRDQQTYEQSAVLFKSAVNRLGGNVVFPSWNVVRSLLVVNGHHIGTTRMSKDPGQGVVDADLKLHTLDNLYCAGSSVFPSTGISNPTFTIITLSIRLAEHIMRRLG